MQFDFVFARNLRHIIGSRGASFWLRGSEHQPQSSEINTEKDADCHDHTKEIKISKILRKGQCQKAAQATEVRLSTLSKGIWIDRLRKPDNVIRKKKQWPLNSTRSLQSSMEVAWRKLQVANCRQKFEIMQRLK